MLTLATSDSVTVQLGGAHVTTAPTFVACWLDNNNALGRLPGTFAGTTPVTAVTAPAAGNRLVADLFVANRDTIAHTVTITHVVSGGASTVVWAEEVAAGETVNLLAPARRGVPGEPGAQGASAYTWRGAWAAGEYAQNDVVSHGGSSYVASQTTTNEPPHEDWTLLAAKGDDGEPGAPGAQGASAYTWRGAWAAGEYAQNDVVSHGGSSYVASQTTTNEPPHEDWTLLAAKGEESGGVVARWTPFAGFAPQAWGYGTLVLTAEIPGARTTTPLRWRCDGDAEGDYRYGIMRAFGGDVEHTPHQGTAQGGSYTADPWAASITLAAGASDEDDYYNGMIVQLIGGTGAGQRAWVIDYDGTTKVATLGMNSCTPAQLRWVKAADATSVYALCHAIVAGQALNADDIVEMEYGDSDRVAVVNIPISGEYSGETVDARLYHTLMGGMIPWAGPIARIVQVGAWNATPDTGSDPLIQLIPEVIEDNNGDGVAPGNDAAGTRPNWSEHGMIGMSGLPLNIGNQLLPGADLDVALKVQGGNGDGADLTVVIVLVLE